jgi:hypothetical protein
MRRLRWLRRGGVYRYDQPVRPSRGRELVLFTLALTTLTALGIYFYRPAGHDKTAATPPHAAISTAASTPVKAGTSGSITPAAGAPALGIAAGSSLTSLSGQQLDNRLQAIAATGATWIRYDFDWSLIQPDNAATYKWQTYDNLVAASSKYHLRVLGILDYTPGWARTSGCDNSQCAPADPQAFAHFASAVANRYKGNGLHYWEVWNEPNNPTYWRPAPDPAAYAQLLHASYQALHAADAQATVLTGGLSPQATTGNSFAPTDFLGALYKAKAGSFFDAVGDHPYTYPLTPADTGDNAWTEMAANTHSLRALMVANGDSAKKIWITEFGAPTNGPGPAATIANPNLDAGPHVVDENLQAKDLTDALQRYQGYSWAGPFFYYSYQDAGTSTDTNENFFGLVRASGSRKPAYTVFSNAAHKINE